MSRARTLAGAIGSDGALNVADVAGLAAVASSGSASDLSTGTLPIARVADGAVTAAKLHTTAVTDKLGFTPANKAGETFTGPVIATGTAAGFRLVGGAANHCYHEWYPRSSDTTLRQAYAGFGGAGDNNFIIANETSSGRIGMSGQAGSFMPAPLQVGRSIYNWYTGGGNPAGQYLHIKTALWAGGSPNGNSQPTMSLFHAIGYNYDGQSINSTMGFHNWSGSNYSLVLTNNGSRAAATGVYTSSDGYIVLVWNTGTSYPGIKIDWHQSFPYTFQYSVPTSAAWSTVTSGVY